MKVKLLVSRAGNGFAQAYGSVVDVDENEARSLLAAGQCEPVDPLPEEKAKRDTKSTQTGNK